MIADHRPPPTGIHNSFLPQPCCHPSHSVTAPPLSRPFEVLRTGACRLGRLEQALEPLPGSHHLIVATLNH